MNEHVWSYNVFSYRISSKYDTRSIYNCVVLDYDKQLSEPSDYIDFYNSRNKFLITHNLKHCETNNQKLQYQNLLQCSISEICI